MVPEKSPYGDYVDILPENFTVLQGIFKAFEKLRWISMRLEFVSACSATTSGAIVFGIEWDFTAKSEETTFKKVTGYTPSLEGPVRSERLVMPLPSVRLQTRDWYTPNLPSGPPIDKGPGRIWWYTNGATAKTVVGQLYIDYEVLLSGTCVP